MWLVFEMLSDCKMGCCTSSLLRLCVSLFLRAAACRRESLCVWLKPWSKVFILPKNCLCVCEAEQWGREATVQLCLHVYADPRYLSGEEEIEGRCVCVCVTARERERASASNSWVRFGISWERERWRRYMMWEVQVTCVAARLRIAKWLTAAN